MVNGRGKYRYWGFLYEDAECVTFSKGGELFIHPCFHGYYLATALFDKGAWRHAEEEHKAELTQYREYLGVEPRLKQLIIDAVDPVSLAEKEDKIMGFLNATVWKLLMHLGSHGKKLDYLDKEMLKNACNEPYHITRDPTK